MSIEINKLRLSPFDEVALKRSTLWLNDPLIKHLTDTPDFTDEQQMQWFRSLSERTNYLVKAVYAEDEIVGVWGLKNINKEEGQAEPFYYIGNKENWGNGIGGWLMDKVFETCRELGLRKVVAKTLPENFRGVNLWFKKGFKIVDYRDGRYHIERIL